MVNRYKEERLRKAARTVREASKITRSIGRLTLLMDLITPSPLFALYLALGFTSDDRRKAYQMWLQAGMAEDDLIRIRQHVNQERALGDERFQRMVKKTLGRPAACRPRGRPKTKEGI
jgi:hypothetical protein